VSFRKKIFEEGLPESDLFFVYLTPHSAASYWVSRELDAAFMRDAEEAGGFLALFVDSETTRSTLAADLRSLHAPILSEAEYARPLGRLVSRAWEAAGARRSRQLQKEVELTIAKIEKEKAALEVRVTRMEQAGARDAADVAARLADRCYIFEGTGISLLEVFHLWAPRIAAGATAAFLQHALEAHFRFMRTKTSDFMRAEGGEAAVDLLGALIIARAVKVHPPTGEYEEIYYLTELGTSLAESAPPDAMQA
jgi:hypothetical protein